VIRLDPRIPLIPAVRMARGLGCELIFLDGEVYLVRRNREENP
jgi:hypothetical protein